MCTTYVYIVPICTYNAYNVSDWTTGLNWTLGVGLCLCLFSNSFVVEEAQVLSFAVSTTLALMLLKTPRGHHRKLFVGAVLATAGLVRLGGLYFRCREEQQGHCSPTDFHKPIGNLPQDVSRAYKNWRFFFTISSGKRATLLRTPKKIIM